VKGLNGVCRRLTTKRFDPFGVGRGLGGRVAVRGFHPRLMMLFPFGELGSGVIVLPRHNFYVAHPRLSLSCHLDIYSDISNHMKTTVEIPDSLLKEVRNLAAQEQTTLRVLVEEGLRRVTTERKRVTRFKLRKVAFRGKGLHPRMAGASWQQVRDAAYEGRGA